MTAPNLTPAEALECLRDKRAVDRGDMASIAFYDKWGTLDHAVYRIIAALETLLSEHEATKAKLAAYEAAQKPAVNVVDGRFGGASGDVLIQGSYEAKGDHHEEYRRMVAEHLKWERSVRDDDAAKLHKLMARQEPAAAVPSDEEIRKAIYMAKNMPQPAWTVSAIELVCQRIGVKL